MNTTLTNKYCEHDFDRALLTLKTCPTAGAAIYPLWGFQMPDSRFVELVQNNVTRPGPR